MDNETNQLNTVLTVLKKQRSQLLTDVIHYEKQIRSRIAGLQKIRNYQNEYDKSENYKISKSVPSLSNNLTSFNYKIKSLIVKEQIEIEKLIFSKSKRSSEIYMLDKKIEKISEKIQTIKMNVVKNLEKIEQTQLDDLAVEMDES